MKVKWTAKTTVRLLMSVLGVLVGGISVGFFKIGALGVDPFQAFMSGMDQLIPISFGTLYVIVNACLLLFSLIFDRHYLGLATLVNLFLLGYVVEFSYGTLLELLPEPSLLMRWACFLFGFVVMCFASSMYMTADMGVSTYDAVALILTHTWKLGQFRYIRITTDVICVVLGVLLLRLGKGTWAEILASVSIGTVMTAFFMGPLIDFFNRKIAIPMLARVDSGKHEFSSGSPE